MEKGRDMNQATKSHFAEIRSFLWETWPEAMIKGALALTLVGEVLKKAARELVPK